MSDAWDRYRRWRCHGAGVELDLAFAGLEETHLEGRRADLERALDALERLEAGAIANPDEDRRVGHYWLRAPDRAPEPEIGAGIRRVREEATSFAAAVHGGRLAPPEGGVFTRVCLIGIGGSALGPWLLADALEGESGLALHLIDNTDPDGIARELGRLVGLHDVLFVVTSKSGRTPETLAGLAAARAACRAEGVDFPARAVAVTGAGSRLDRLARDEGWCHVFPIQEWVGGRTSLWSAVGLVPAALLGIDVAGLLEGAAAMDEAGRRRELRANPAVLLALLWHVEGGGRGERAMVVLPYCDRLQLLGRYLQQLVMESLGKERDRSGAVVHQGLTVYGNKGSTDQHAYVQQLRDGRHDAFAVFVRVLGRDAATDPEVLDGARAGDLLDGFWQGTREALFERGRHSATLHLPRLDARSLGALLALFERAVGLYAELVDVNAYHQPGVEAGKRAAADVVALQAALLRALDGTPRPVDELAASVGGDPLRVHEVLRHLAATREEVVCHLREGVEEAYGLSPDAL